MAKARRTTHRSAPAKPSSPSTAKDAFDRVRSEIDALPPEKIIAITLDVPTAVSIALGAAGHIESLTDAIASLPGIESKKVQRIRLYALAAWYAHLSLVGERPNPTEFKALLEEATKLRQSLLVAAEALADRGLLSAERVTEIRSGTGHVDAANDLVALGALFADAWGQVEHKTAVEAAEWTRAAELGPALLVALAVRKRGSIELEPRDPNAQAIRQRAFSLLFHAYEECRRAVTYLRWYERDAEAIVPSLWTRRRRRTSTAAEDSERPEPTMPPLTELAPSV